MCIIRARRTTALDHVKRSTWFREFIARDFASIPAAVAQRPSKALCESIERSVPFGALVTQVIEATVASLETDLQEAPMLDEIQTRSNVSAETITETSAGTLLDDPARERVADPLAVPMR